jgi:hypothetical protein
MKSATTLQAQLSRKRDAIALESRSLKPRSPALDHLLGAGVPAFSGIIGGIFDSGSAPLKILVLAVIVAAIFATRLGPRDR